jgi:two-component system nitrate/nitrite response regulator NarL
LSGERDVREARRRVTDQIRVIVADDHPMFREGVIAALRRAGDIAIVGEAEDAAEAVRLAREYLPDVALLDVTMPGSGLQAALEISASCPTTKVVMLTVSDDEDKLLAALKAGASGYALKGIPGRELVAIIRAVHGGEVYVAPPLAGRVLAEMSKPRSVDPLGELTERERAVLELVATGLSNQEIGRQLSLAEKTVKHYMTSILSKLHVRSRVEAALLAQKAGLGER